MTFRTFIQKLAEQRNTSPRLGALMNAYSSTAVLYSPLTLIGVVTTIYGLWGKSWLAHYIPWMTFPILLMCMIGVILVAMVFFYKIVIPSQVAFAMQQNYKHRNPLVADMATSLQNDKDILAKLEAIEKRLEELEKNH